VLRGHSWHWEMMHILKFEDQSGMNTRTTVIEAFTLQSYDPYVRNSTSSKYCRGAKVRIG
jgi:hypothetical protein